MVQNLHHFRVCVFILLQLAFLDCQSMQHLMAVSQSFLCPARVSELLAPRLDYKLPHDTITARFVYWLAHLLGLLCERIYDLHQGHFFLVVNVRRDFVVQVVSQLEQMELKCAKCWVKTLQELFPWVERRPVALSYLLQDANLVPHIFSVR